MSVNQYLLEVGTEELPSGFLETAPTELGGKVKTALEELNVPVKAVAVYATPRRLALKITGLPDKQGDREVVLKGPPARIGLDEKGQLTQAAQGFAKKSGLDPKMLKQETLDGEDGEIYLVARQTMPGKPMKDLLAEILPGLVLGLSGSHFMCWGETEIKFSRPIRWLLSLWNDQHLPVTIGPVNSSNCSYGHRVLSSGEPIAVASVDAYVETLSKQGAVTVDQCQRRESIWKQLQEVAHSLKGNVIENPALLETVTMLVEAPSIVVGRFQERFLQVPDEVMTTVMTTHQKYFPVVDGSGKLMPYFLTVSNGKPESAETIRLGNEKVITARFEDARFFFEEDQKVALIDRLPDLKGVTFQKGMGSLFDKAERLKQLTATTADQLKLSAAEKTQALRAATLAKADLVTGMVFEFTELQGIMGQKYASLQGEPEAVSTAIFEHYLPRFTGDAVAKSPVGIAVSLADKLDTMVCVFAQENAKLPTGSKDPMGLRRMAMGVMQTVLQNQLSVDITALLQAAYANLGKLATASEETMLTRLREFMLQRLKVNLLEDNSRHDLIEAVLDAAGCDPLSDLLDVTTRLTHLKTLVQNEAALKAIYEPANRITKILGEKYNPSVTVKDIDPAKFSDETEKALFDAVQAVHQKAKAGDYPALIAALQPMTMPVERFFEKVLINDPDESIRKNRYTLLSLVNQSYVRLAQFSRLSVV